MKLGFVTAILPDLSLEEVLSTAADIGYDCVEVMCWPKGKAERRYAGVTHLDVSEFTTEAADTVHQLTETYGVKISALGYYPNPLSPDIAESQAAIDHIYKTIDAAATLGIYQMNTFVGRDWTKSVADNWPMFLEVWKPLIAHAEVRGVKIGIENCPMYFTKDEWPGGKNLKTTPTIFRQMYEDINSDHFGLNFDPSHFVWLQMDYLKAIREFGHKLFHLHAKDARLEKDRLNEVGIMAFPNDFHSPRIPGKGDVNWQRFFEAIQATGYTGAVCVEVEDRAYEDTLERRIQSLKDSYDYLRPFTPKT